MSERLTVDVRQKSFNGRTIIRNIRFDVAAGEIVAVLGASGCGKSTLLRAIAGLDGDYVGSINIHGANQNIIGMIYQEPRLMPWLTVEENIAFGLVNNTAPQSNPSIDGLLQEVMLENARQYLPKQLSGGMAQRVAIARALVREPDVLLMDEPFSSLDVLTRRSLHKLTRAITVKHQTATVIVTHDVDEAVNLADRVLVLAHDSTGIATIQHDIRPSPNKHARFDEIEAIIAALESTKREVA
jgi:sulfonate transport system ATP-binding protein